MNVKSMTPERLGRRIRKLRQEKSLSQEELADPDYTAAYISHIEHGKRRPSQAVLDHIAMRLGMTTEQLVSGRDPEDDLRLEVATQRAMAEIHLGHAEEALESLQDLRKEISKLGHLALLEAVETSMGLALFRLGRIDEAAGAYDRALSLMEGASPERRTAALVGKARCLFNSQEVRESVHMLEMHLVELERSEFSDPGCVVETYAALIPGYFETDNLDLAMDAATRGWRLASKAPDAAQRACLYVNRAQLLVTQGGYRDALASLALAADIYRHLGWYAESVKVAFARSFALTKQGEWSEAEELIREALQTPGSTVNKADRIRLSTRLAFIRRNVGDAEEALDLARQALKLAGSAFAGSAAEAEREMGLCLADLGDASAALEYWRKALKKFVKTGDKDEAAETARLIGDHLMQHGDHEGAALAYREGLA